MVDYTSHDLNRAAHILQALRWHGEEERRLWETELEEGLSIADLQANAEQFYDDVDLLESFRLDYPAVLLGDNRVFVPVALSEIIAPKALQATLTASYQRRSRPGPYWFFFRYLLRFIPRPSLRNMLSEAIKRGMVRFGDGATMLSPAEARETFFQRACEFLATRIAGRRSFRGGEPPDGPAPELSMRKFIGGPPTKVAGCIFSVHTKSPGLSAYWSGAYLISSNYHGAPTTPARGVLQAGTYVFGVSGGAYGNTVQWDQNKVCTLPGTSSVTLDY
ncbi:hypothetical protein HAP47_0022870 [Bradyrhizobium sp. 41S5]|uniref:hypothetical protein n=1 Tax=Bradyrhizobium sp. 41S5 TaxID=1404443 RepID=UPI00156AECB8|nr:hypothetical protein [Bradyrhizobium sp. 41S5]UFX42107.1 hypothetical protein HAP47_0022870 [Bradyrhizobium sp. 41S5]